MYKPLKYQLTEITCIWQPLTKIRKSTKCLTKQTFLGAGDTKSNEVCPITKSTTLDSLKFLHLLGDF